MIQCQQAYTPATPEDGCRILVDRLWPRNCQKEQLQLNAWLPDVAPSSQLHQALKTGELDFAQFTVAYRFELAARPQNWWELLQFAERGTLTLVYGAKDSQVNNAVVLAQWLEEELDRYSSSSSPVCYLDDFPDY